MKFIIRYKFVILACLIIIVLYFGLRVPNLTLQPIFADEAIYIRWAQVMKSEPTLRFLPLSDGKAPLFMWTMIPFLKVFSDPLFAGRFLSVLSGFATLLGVFLLSIRIFNLRVAIWASLIYAIVPFTVFFDRMALTDSMLSAFTIWSLYFTVWILQTQRLDLSFILGYMLGGALLTKTPAMLNILSLPITILGFNFINAKKFALLKLLIFWGVAVLTALVIYNILRLGPEFHQLSARNVDYVFSPWELKNRPLDPFIPHLKNLADWFPKLLTWPVLGFMVIGLWFIARTKSKLGWVIFFWAIVPLLIQMAFLKTFTARYILFSIPPLLIIVAFGLEKLIELLTIKKHVSLLLALVIILPMALLFDYTNLTKPEDLPLPPEERRGYFEDWTAGYGFPEIAQYLILQKQNGPVLIGTEGLFGTLPDGLMIYLDKAGIPFVGSKESTISAKLKDATRENQTFFVANKSRAGENVEGAKLIKEYPKAKPKSGKQDSILLFKVVK